MVTWLDNTHHHRRNLPWLTDGKVSAIGAPGPVDLWIFSDEDADGLNDAASAFGIVVPRWIDRPGTYHNYGFEFAVAQGPCETHQ